MKMMAIKSSCEVHLFLFIFNCRFMNIFMHMYVFEIKCKNHADLFPYLFASASNKHYTIISLDVMLSCLMNILCQL